MVLNVSCVAKIRQFFDIVMILNHKKSKKNSHPAMGWLFLDDLEGNGVYFTITFTPFRM